MTFDRIVDRIERSGEIPTIGPVATEVIRLAGDPDADFRAVGQTIVRDPALAARVLRVANSPFYGVRGEVGTVDRAVALLGMAETRNIVLSVSVIRDFSGTLGENGFDWERFWEHSSGVGLIAQALTRLLRLPLGGYEYSAGLLHDVGKILLGHHFPEEFARALERAREAGISLEQAEQEVFRTDHARLGDWLAGRWSFPEPLRDGLAWHHHPAQAGDHRVLAAVIQVADALAKAKCIGFGGDQMAVCLGDTEGWGVLAEERPELAEVDLARFTFQLDEKVDAARRLFREARGT